MSISGDDIKALVLAGERGGPSALREAEDVASKAEIKIDGIAMLDRVLGALSESRITNPCHIAGANPLTRERLSSSAAYGDLVYLPAGDGPASTVLSCLESLDRYPVLITTCDHPLLTPEMIDSFIDASLASGADLTVGLASKTVIEAAYPQASRTYFPIGGRKVSGCNLFLARTPAALNAVRFWREAEADRKHPVRIARRFGLISMLQILRPGMNFDGVFRILSQRLDCTVRPVMMPFAEAAIDVDKPEDLSLVRTIIRARTLE